MKPNEPLKPCPFCGAKADIRSLFYPEPREKRCLVVFCRSCKACIRGSTSEQVAVNRWNRRDSND